MKLISCFRYNRSFDRHPLLFAAGFGSIYALTNKIGACFGVFLLSPTSLQQVSELFSPSSICLRHSCGAIFSEDLFRCLTFYDYAEPNTPTKICL